MLIDTYTHISNYLNFLLIIHLLYIVHVQKCMLVVQSTGAFYFILGNVQPKLRQRLHNIQLLALVIVNDNGMNKILEHILKDIKKLEQVIFSTIQITISYDLTLGIHIEGIAWPFKGTVAVCSADNPAS